MISTRVLSLVLYLLSFLYLASICDALPTDPPSNVTHALFKRRCKFDLASGEWQCDSEMPTTSQLIAQMQDEPGGMATANRMVIFYNNLNDPALAPGKDPSVSWVVGWLDANGFANKYFWWGECVNQYCKQVRLIRSPHSGAACPPSATYHSGPVPPASYHTAFAQVIFTTREMLTSKQGSTLNPNSSAKTPKSMKANGAKTPCGRSRNAFSSPCPLQPSIPTPTSSHRAARPGRTTLLG